MGFSIKQTYIPSNSTSGAPNVQLPLELVQTANAPTIRISSTASANAGIVFLGKYGANITQNVNGGYGLSVTRNLNETGANPLVSITEQHAASTQVPLTVTGNALQWAQQITTGKYGLQLVNGIGGPTGTDIQGSGTWKVDGEGKIFPAQYAAASPPGTQEGGIWYDSTNHVLKYHNGTEVKTIATA